MSEAAFATLWIGPSLGPYEELCLKSFVNCGYAISVYSYDTDLRLPLGVQWKDANLVVPSEEVFDNPAKPGSFALFSNIFRYRLFRRTSEIWVDADVLALRPGFITSEFVWGFEDPLKVNGAILRVPGRSPVLDFLEETAQTRVLSGHVKWGDAGPNLVTEGIDRFNLWQSVRKQQAFYPIYFREVWKLYDPASRDKVTSSLHGSVFLHLWNEVLGGPSGEVKRHRPPAGSYMSEAFEVHGVAHLVKERPELPSDWARRVWAKRLNTSRSRLRGAVYCVLGPLHTDRFPRARSILQKMRRIGLL